MRIPVSEAENLLLSSARDWLTENKSSGIARPEGIDFATAVLHEKIVGQSKNRKFYEEVFSEPFEEKIQFDLVGVVPGAFYRKHKETGANGRRIFEIARTLGCPAALIEVENFGELTTNAEIILRWLESHAGKRILLVSLSKGSAELRIALESQRAAVAFGNVVAWVSISGLVKGTPLVAWLKNRPLRWLGIHCLLLFNRDKLAALNQLSHENKFCLGKWPSIPPQLRIVHINAFPLRHHLRHPWAGRGYERLAPLGPNDGGGILLEDLLDVPGIVFPIWGADHYLMPEWNVEELIQRIVLKAASPKE